MLMDKLICVKKKWDSMDIYFKILKVGPQRMHTSNISSLHIINTVWAYQNLRSNVAFLHEINKEVLNTE